MYDILQLKSKSLEELQSLASEMGLKSAKSTDKNVLVYDILDEQAIHASKNNSEKTAKVRNKVTRKNEPEKVYTANGEKGKSKSNDKKQNAPKPDKKETKEVKEPQAQAPAPAAAPAAAPAPDL